MADDNFGGIKITWVDETGGEGKNGTKDSSNSAKMIAGITTMVSATTAILSLVGEAVSGVLKPVKTIILAVLKQIAQILRPVADVIILLLQPLLMFLKPIIKAFNEAIRPFRQAAYKFMAMANVETDPQKKTELMAASMTSIFTGLGVGLLQIQTELIKSVVNILLEVSRGVLEWFGVDVDELKNSINGFIDKGMEFIKTNALEGITNMATRLGVDLNTSLQNGIDKAFSNLKIPETFGQQNASSSSIKRIDLTNDTSAINYISSATARAQQYSGMSAAQVLAKMKYGVKVNGG